LKSDEAEERKCSHQIRKLSEMQTDGKDEEEKEEEEAGTLNERLRKS
jgi:hypothetical protein